MIEPHMHTLWIWLVISEGLFALLLGIVWGVRRSEPALVYWVLASLCLSLACLFFSLHGRLPDWLSIPVANTLLVLAWTLRWAGLRRFANQPLRVWWYVAGPLLVGVLFTLPEPLGPDMGTRVAISAFSGGFYAVLIIVDALRAGRSERLVMRQVIIAMACMIILFEICLSVLNLRGSAPAHFLAQNPANATMLLGLLALFALFDLASFLMVFERYENQLVRQATVDSLTNVLNRAGFSALANRQLQRNLRTGKPVSVLVMDLDFFKAVNDRYGHEAGDAVLRAFAQAARGALRPTDLLARSGGEEFWALLCKTDLAEAQQVAQRVCDGFRDTRVSFAGHTITATASIGVAEVHLATEVVQMALARADHALYDAKHAGRDRVVLAGTPHAAPMAA